MLLEENKSPYRISRMRMYKVNQQAFFFILENNFNGGNRPPEPRNNN